MIEVRPATRADFEAICGQAPPMTVKAVTLTNDGKPLAIGGYFIANDFAMAFSDNSAALTKRQLVHGARALMNLLKTARLQVIATDQFGETALKHFGFRPWNQVWRLG